LRRPVTQLGNMEVSEHLITGSWSANCHSLYINLCYRWFKSLRWYHPVTSMHTGEWHPPRDQSSFLPICHCHQQNHE
jgi:hypothetical protein